MSNTPNRASNSAGKPRKREIVHDLATARRMLPLVQSIVTDVIAARRALDALVPEQERLDRNRRELAWQERQRRYQITDEIAAAERRWATAVGELTELGVALVNDETGEVDFPTKVNGRLAAFSWLVGEPELKHWHYADDEVRRAIPTEWEKAGTVTPTRSRRGQS